MTEQEFIEQEEKRIAVEQKKQLSIAGKPIENAPQIALPPELFEQFQSIHTRLKEQEDWFSSVQTLLERNNEKLSQLYTLLQAHVVNDAGAADIINLLRVKLKKEEPSE